MKEYASEYLRNVALVGHQGCGKTSLVEALLFNSGVTSRLGRVEEGTTVSDWEDDEKQRQISLSTALVPVEFEDHKINLLDAPGFVDFQGEIRNAIRVADSVMVVVDAVAGVEVGTELAWDYAKQFLQPIIVVINKVDRENADDAYMEKYFGTGVLENDEIRDGMRKAARNHALNTVPVFVTSAAKNIGTYPVLEALIAYTSPPTVRRYGVHRGDSEEIEYIAPPQADEGKLGAYVFKTLNDRFVGTLSFVRVFSGKITSDSRNWNNTRGTDERFTGLMTMRGKEQVPLGVLHAGDIGVVAKFINTQTGDTFGDHDKEFQIVKPDFDEPLYAVSLQPKTQQDAAKIGTVLTTLVQADPTLRWRNDAATSQIILEGMGDIHVQVALSRAEKLGVAVTTEMPRVSLKETVTKKAEAMYRHKKQSGGAGQFGEISLFVEPNTGEGFLYEAKVTGGSVTATFLDSVNKGIQQVLPVGVIAGYPVVDVHVVAFDGKMHPVDSKDIAFQIAGREAFKEAFRDANPVLMEPIMDVKITVPESMMGDIISDLNTKRGRVQGMDTTGGGKSIVVAQVPQSEMMRYGNDLRSMTGGRGIYSMTFAHYEKVPQHIAEPIMAAYKPHATND
jgi:elongation factor G